MNRHRSRRLIEPPARALQIGTAAPSGTRTGHECVIIDDDPDICDLIASVVSQISMQSVKVVSPSALSNALERPHPSIVFLDVGLGNWDAVDAIKLLGRQQFKGVVQLISGRDQALLREVRGLGERHGLKMLPALRKPFISDHLVSAARASRAEESASAAETKVVSDIRTASPLLSHVSITTALQQSWLDVHYQPKIDLATGRIVGAEGLARVQHPTRGQLVPSAFLPGASKRELDQLTEFVVLKAFRDWEALERAGYNLRLAVNASVAALTSPNLVSIIRDNRPRSASWPGLIIEVTEGDAIDDIERTTEIAVQLRIHQVGLAIDDFGMGYSTLTRLKQFAFSELKLDRSYVHNCSTDPVNFCICQAVINLAHASQAVAVAEGVEQVDDRNDLFAMGCDVAQGYLFARPMSLGKLIETLAA